VVLDEIPSVRERPLDPTDTTKLGGDALGRARLKQITGRLNEVRRRSVDDPAEAHRPNRATEALDAVLADLDDCLTTPARAMGLDDIDLRLAAIEELFDSSGSPGLGRVVSSIRTSLSAAIENAPADDEPPPPRRFTPPPTAAVRRARPRKGPTPAAVRSRKGSSRWLIPGVVIAAVIAVAAVVTLRRIAPETPPPEPTVRAVTEGQPVSEAPVPAATPTQRPEPSRFDDEFESREEQMARFTLEINLAESTLRAGDLHASLRHFAAAAAIDRFHRRVISMGKSLIAALLHEADLAGDKGDWELAGRRIDDARNIARGLRLDDSVVDSTAQKLATMTRFDDISPQDAEGLQNAIGRPVRLTLKTSDVILGQLLDVKDGILLLDVYSGVKGGGVEFSTSILASTIKEIRVYDAKRPSEIMAGE
jgi:hypothetical protein